MTTSSESDYFALVGRVYYQCRAVDSLAIDISRDLDRSQVPYSSVRKPSGVIADTLARSATAGDISNSARVLVVSAAEEMNALVDRRTVVLESRPGRDEEGNETLYRRAFQIDSAETVSKSFLAELAHDLEAVLRRLSGARGECQSALAA